MPLETQILKPDKTVRKIKGGWLFFHVNCMMTVALKEGDPDFSIRETEPRTMGEVGTFEYEGETYEVCVDFSMSPVYYFNTKSKLWLKGSQVVKQDHKFLGPENKPFTIHAGETLRMQRVSK